MKIQTIFGWYFIIWGLAIMFVIPNDAPPRLINYCIIGAYICSIFWWWFNQHHAGWTAYWISAMCITLVVTFMNLATNTN